MSNNFEKALEKGPLVYPVRGWSMTPLLREKRDLVVIKPLGEHVCKKNDVILYRVNDRYVLHRILKVRAGDYVLCGDRCLQKEFGITREQILGVMTSFIKNSKEISTNSLRCRIYNFFWCDLFFLRVVVLKVGSFFKRFFKRRA